MEEENNTNLPDTKLEGLSQKIEFKNPANGVEKAQILSVVNSSEKEPHILLAVTREGNDKPVAIFQKSEDGKISLRLEKNFANSFAGVSIAKDEAGEYFSYDMSKVAFSQTRGIETGEVRGKGKIAIAISAIGAYIDDLKGGKKSQPTQNPFNIALSKEFLQMSLSKEENGCTMEKEEPLFSAVMVSAIQLERRNQNNLKKDEVVSSTFGDITLHSVPIKNPDGTISYINMKEEGGKVSAYVQTNEKGKANSKTFPKFEPIHSVRLARGNLAGQPIESFVVEFQLSNGARRTVYIDANFDDNQTFLGLMENGILQKASANPVKTDGAKRADLEDYHGHDVYDFTGQTNVEHADFDQVGVLTVKEVEKQAEAETSVGKSGNAEAPVQPAPQPQPIPQPSPAPAPQPTAPDYEQPHVPYSPGYDGDYDYNIIPPQEDPQPEQPDDENPPINPTPTPDVPDAPQAPEVPQEPENPHEDPAPDTPAPAQPEAPAQEAPKQEKPKEAKKPLWEIKPVDPKKKGMLYGLAAVCLALSCLMPIPFAILTIIMAAWAVCYDNEVLNKIKKALNEAKTKPDKEKENSLDKNLDKQLAKVKENLKEKTEAYNEINREIELLEGAATPDKAKIEKLKKKRDDLLGQVEKLQHQEKAVQINIQAANKLQQQEELRKQVTQLETEAKKMGKKTSVEDVNSITQKLGDAYRNLNTLEGENKSLNQEFLNEIKNQKTAEGYEVNLDERNYISTGDDFTIPKTADEKEAEKLEAIENMNEEDLTEEQKEFKKKLRKKFKKDKGGRER